MSSPRDTIDFHVSNSPLGVVEWDQDFRICFWSGRAEEIFGWAAADVLGKHPDDWPFVHEDDVDSVHQVMDDLINGKVERNISANRNYTKENQVVYCEWYNSVLKNEEGIVISVFCLVHDVTERVETEFQLHQLQKIESVGQLTGGIAHDFNNLLSVILGNTELLAEALEHQPKLKNFVNAIDSAANRGAELTHRLLSFSRRQPLRSAAIDVGHLVEGLRELLERTLGEQFNLEMRILSSASVNVDAAQLESSLLNLCLNARDAMPEGGQLIIDCSDIHLDAAKIDNEGELVSGDYVVIAVVDSGIGMTMAEQQHALEPFFTTKEAGKGTGLGLSMVHGFVKQSLGHLQIDSEPDNGTTMRVFLPISHEKPVVIDQKKANPGTLRGDETILIVEDDEAIRNLAKISLEKLGYRILQAHDGHSALGQIMSDESIDLLFTDVVMPGGLSGPELVKKAAALRPNLKILYTSGYSKDAITDESRDGVKIQLLVKPYRGTSLARQVRQMLGPKS